MWLKKREVVVFSFGVGREGEGRKDGVEKVGQFLVVECGLWVEIRELWSARDGG
jgi:hypothetical protein